MKKIIFTLLFFICSISYGQNLTCGTKGFIGHPANFNRSSIVQPSDTDLTTPYVFNVYFTLIKDSDGYYNQPWYDYLSTPQLIESQFLRCVKILNIRFNPHNIYFKYVGYSEERNSIFSFATPFIGYEGSSSWEALNQFREENAINFYFVNGLVVSDSDVGVVSQMGGKDIVMSSGNLLNFPAYEAGLDISLNHAIGHCFSLYHTHEAESHFQPGTDLYNLTRCERVNRIPNSNPAIYNADIAGDEVTDTPAQPNVDEGNFLPNCGGYIVNPLLLNFYNEVYPPDITPNYMNVPGVSSSSCWDLGFTPGQIARMRNFIATNTTHYAYLPGGESARTDVATLYEPFDAKVVVGDVISTEDQPDLGGALVCRTQKYQLRFQPGYEQIFHDVVGGSISQMADQQFNYINTFDHAIGVEIPSLSNQIRGGIGVINSITPYTCTFESYVSGTVYSMEVLGSMNITVKQLNEIEAKDPELYDNLMQQYYYILKKYTTTGVKIEQTFYKN